MTKPGINAAFTTQIHFTEHQPSNRSITQKNGRVCLHPHSTTGTIAGFDAAHSDDLRSLSLFKYIHLRELMALGCSVAGHSTEKIAFPTINGSTKRMTA